MTKTTLELQREILDLKVKVSKLNTSLIYWKNVAGKLRLVVGGDNDL